MPRKRIVLALILLAVIGLSIQSTLPLEAQEAPPLTLDQVRALIAIPVPDTALATEVRKKGIDFPVSIQLLDELQEFGAGPIALVAIMEMGGGVNGSAPTSAVEVATGHLSVNPSIPGTRLEMQDLGAFDDRITWLEVEPGRYSVKISCPFCLESTVEAEVRAGETTEIAVPIEFDQPLLDQSLDRSRSAFAAGDFSTALEAASQIASFFPQHEEALRIGIESAFRAGSPEILLNLGSAALRAGIDFSLPLQYQLQLGAKLYPCALEIGTDRVIFEPGKKVSIRGVRTGTSFLRSQIVKASVENEDNGNIWLRVSIGNGSSSKEVDRFRFAHPEAEMVKARKRAEMPGVAIKFKGHVMDYPRGTGEVLRAVAQLLQQPVPER